MLFGCVVFGWFFGLVGASCTVAGWLLVVCGAFVASFGVFVCGCWLLLVCI